ncbi:MAG: SoxR reducing system RseC family protein [Desulfobacteraceae bacterium]
MATEKGVVTGATPHKVWIKTLRASSCEACEAKDSCEEKRNIKEMTVQVDNTLNASVGDHVILGIKTAPLLKLTFMLYIFPIILLTAGAAAGQIFAPALGLDPSLTSLGAGVAGFAAAFVLVRIANNRLAGKKEFSPYLVRILKR